MKIACALVLIIIMLFFASCAPDIVAAGGVVVRGDATTPTIPQTDDTVFVTKSGSKYHLEDCSYLSDSSIPISREQAIAEGKEPCSKCLPDG